MKTEIRKLDRNEIEKFMELIRVFEEVFEMKNFSMPGEAYLKKLLNRDDFFVFVAITENKMVGGLTSYILQQYYSESSLVYIYDLAIKAEYQRQGIGRKLIAANNDYSKTIGAEVVLVQADVVDLHAIEFYRSTGGKGEDVIHFDYVL
jgi:ribosomal protein S18 acetylase RimI-like enzyme